MEGPKTTQDAAGAPEEEEIEQGNKHAEVNQDPESKAKVTDSTGADISDKINMSHLRLEDQTWELIQVPKEITSNLIAKGFKGPSRIQFQVKTLLNSNLKEGKTTDLVVQSQNGSGKTLSFLVPSLCMCTPDHAAPKGILAPQVIILADTKELIYQIWKIANLIKPDFVKIDYHVKDKEKTDGPGVGAAAHVFLTSHKSLAGMLKNKKVDLSQVKFFVLDEADNILKDDEGAQSLNILIKNLPKTSIVGMFSATLPDKAIAMLGQHKRPYSKIVVENKSDLSLKSLTHYFVRCNRKQKLEFVSNFLNKVTQGSVILFVNSKNFAQDFAVNLNKDNHKTQILVGDMEMSDRTRILDQFKSGQLKVLVTTNLLSRGIDARKISLVVNVDMPYKYKSTDEKGQDRRDKLDAETYLHRVGRTGRFGDQGIAINLIEDDRAFHDLNLIEQSYGISMIEMQLNNFEDVIRRNEQNTQLNQKKREELEENI